MSSDSPRNPLPFEPTGKRKKVEPGSTEGKAGQKPAKLSKKSTRQAAAKASSQKSVTQKPAKEKTALSASPSSRSDAAIPEVVSRRMFRRMVIFSGVPTFIGVGIFFLSYYLLVNHIVDLPKYAVFLSTLGCFGLGVVGLSYGALSASWDEDRLGGWFGGSEFKANFSRLTEAWRAPRKSS